VSWKSNDTSYSIAINRTESGNSVTGWLLLRRYEVWSPVGIRLGISRFSSVSRREWCLQNPHGLFLLCLKSVEHNLILLGKLIITKLVKKLAVFYLTEGSLPCSEEHATWVNPEPVESTPHPQTSFI
jgi:hypothetical protein